MKLWPAKGCRPSLRWRLWLGAGALSLLALGGAGFALFALTATERRAQEALAAQTRLEAWASLSTRINEWVVSHLVQPEGLDPSPVSAAIDRLEALTEADVMAAPREAEASLRAADARYVAQIRSFWRQLSGLSGDTPAGVAGIQFHLAHAPQVINQRIDHETRRRDTALREMEGLRTPLRVGMALIGAAVPVLLLVLWAGTLRPLLGRLRQASDQAEAWVLPQRRARGQGHDELGLMFARLRQMGARLARGQARLQAQKAALEATITERTRDLSHANQRLAAIDASRRRFFADVSHELRTPLTVIMGEAELGRAAPDPDLRQSFATIQTRAERLFRRIEDLLRIARSESGQLEFNPAPVALADVIALARSDLGPLLDRGGVRLSVDIPEGLHVYADGDWLRQVFAGLFENSLKYAGRGRTIHVKAAAQDQTVWMEVADDGPNPPPEGQALFDRHERGARGGSGFGVGLSLAKWVIEASGGDLRRLPAAQGFRLGISVPLWEEELWPTS